MRLQHHILLALLTGFAFFLVAAEPSPNLRLETWKGLWWKDASYEQLKTERAKKMLFGTNVTITTKDLNLTPVEFLRQHVSKPEDAFGFNYGVIYRRSADGKSYTIYDSGWFQGLTMKNMKEGDLIAYYQESW